MKDSNIEEKVVKLKQLGLEFNTLMAELEGLNVEVRVSYVESKSKDNITQGIHIWRIVEHNDYLE
jgi:hypothetical protein